MSNQLIAVALSLIVIASKTLAMENSSIEKQLPQEWEDISTTEDGINPTDCSSPGAQCVLLDRGTKIHWTSVNLREKLSGQSVIANFEDAKSGCKSLEEWGGFSDWRMPTRFELLDAKVRLINLGKRVEPMRASGFFWTSSFFHPEEDSLDSPPSIGSEKVWAISMEDSKMRAFRKEALFSSFCIRDDYFKAWEDVSKKADGVTPTPCLSPADQCSLKDKRSQLLWTELSPGLKRGDNNEFVNINQAAQHCASLTWNNLRGWRLPSLRELSQAMKHGLKVVSLSKEDFGPLSELWSSSVKGERFFGIHHYYLTVDYPYVGESISSSGETKGAESEFVSTYPAYSSFNPGPKRKRLPFLCVYGQGDAPVPPTVQPHQQTFPAPPVIRVSPPVVVDEYIEAPPMRGRRGRH